MQTMMTWLKPGGRQGLGSHFAFLSQSLYFFLSKGGELRAIF